MIIGAFPGFSWLAMQGVHEFSHVVGANSTGGRVIKLIMHQKTMADKTAD